MWSLICLTLLAAAPDYRAPVPDAPVWTIAADGSMVELYSVSVDELPADEPEVVEIIHTSKPTIKPTVINHTRHDGCMCPGMCYGQHLANAHGVTNDEWNRLKLWQGNKMVDLHKKLHREGVYEKPKGGCPGGVCVPRQRVGLIKRVLSFRGRR